MLLSQLGPVRKPICPTLIHDEATGVVVSVVLLVACVYALCRVMAYFNRP